MDRASTDRSAALRLFIAVHPPEPPRRYLESVLSELKKTVPGYSVRWARPDNIHLTLRFLGDLPAAELPPLNGALALAVRGMSSFKLRIGTPGCFPNRRAPRVLWIGLQGDLAALGNLQRSVQQATATWGELESRDFHPHLTLGRVNSKRRSDLAAIDQAMTGLKLPTTEPWRVDKIHLTHSELRPSGAVYTSLGEFSLAS